MAIRRISIYDMDGTIVDSSHRYRTIMGSDGKVRIDLAHWRENQPLAMLDKLLPMAKQYRADLRDPECYVIIATARVMNEPDWQYVREILGEPNYFICRKEGDSRGGAILKILGLTKFFNLKNFRTARATFYEDNASYLKEVCDHFGIGGVYVPSNQGH